MAKKPKKRPGILVRFYPSDMAALNKHCADACTPRENFIRRVVLAAIVPATPTTLKKGK